jgi:hypothetical protein
MRCCDPSSSDEAAREVALFVLLFLHIATMFTFVGLVGAVLVPSVIAARARKWAAPATFTTSAASG